MAGDRILLATRKGLLTLDRGPVDWAVGTMAFPGETLSYAMACPRTGVYWACFDHGH